MLTRIKNFFASLFNQDLSPKHIAAAFCLGNYIAFSPFFGLHGIMVFVFSWLFGLHFGIMFAAAYGINNPWTAIPIYSADYFFGHWLVHSIFQLPTANITPWWLDYVSNKFAAFTGFAKPCMISFLIGGNLLGILVSVLLYPIILRACYSFRTQT
ncbi:MAG: DUF2062 domain-containing protein [Candidatus Babeliales bacterium]